jgi:hypothetical protein
LGDFLALEELYFSMPPPSQWTFKSPLQQLESIVDSYGCLGHASGIMHYAAPEKDGCTVVVGIHVRDPKKKWIVKHHLSMKDAFGRDFSVHYDDVSSSWCCDYNIVAFDLEREVLFLFEYKMQKLLSYNIATGKLNTIKDVHQWYKYCVMVLKDPRPRSLYLKISCTGRDGFACSKIIILLLLTRRGMSPSTLIQSLCNMLLKVSSRES